MRDINACKKCKYYIEDLDGYVFENSFNVVSSSEIFSMSNLRASRLAHTKHFCKLDFYAGLARTLYDLYDLKTQNEFYMRDIDKECPFYVEHYLYSLGHDAKRPNYGFMRFFRRKRICQHCGEVIPNREWCPHCGYDRFEVVDEFPKQCACQLAAVLVVIAIVAIVAFC